MRRHGYTTFGLVAAAVAVVGYLVGGAIRFDAPGKLPAGVVGAPAAPALTLADVDHQFLNDEWGQSISNDSFWRNRRSGSTASAAPSKSRLQGPPPDSSWFAAPPPKGSWGADQGPPRSSGRPVAGYRTVCVRLCDGFFFPVSFGTSEGNFSRDQSTCNNACPGARLYSYKPGSEDPEDMVDTSGQAYSKLKNANLFRTQYVENCKCKPHPWEQEASERHRVYALEDQRRKGNRTVVAELEELKAKQRTETYGSNASRRRGTNDRNRRRAPAGEDQTKATQPVTVAEGSSAPRSDATRGQGGERMATAALPSPAQSAPTTTGSIAPTSTVTAASMARTMTDAASPSASPIGRAAQREPDAQGEAKAGQPTAVAVPVVATVSDPASIDVGEAPAPATTADPIPVQIPETVTAAPFAPAAVKPTLATRRAERRAQSRPVEGDAAAARRPAGIMNLGAPTRRSPAPAQSWRPARDTSWTARVFQ